MVLKKIRFGNSPATLASKKLKSVLGGYGVYDGQVCCIYEDGPYQNCCWSEDECEELAGFSNHWECGTDNARSRCCLK